MYAEKESNIPNCIPKETIGPDKPLFSCGIIDINHPSVAEQHKMYYYIYHVIESRLDFHTIWSWLTDILARNKEFEHKHHHRQSHDIFLFQPRIKHIIQYYQHCSTSKLTNSDPGFPPSNPGNISWINKRRIKNFQSKWQSGKLKSRHVLVTNTSMTELNPGVSEYLILKCDLDLGLVKFFHSIL